MSNTIVILQIDEQRDTMKSYIKFCISSIKLLNIIFLINVISKWDVEIVM